MLEPKACILARVAEPGHRPMRPLTRIARIHRAGVEGKLFAISNAELSDGRKLTDVLKSTLNGDGGICGDIVGSTPAGRDSLLQKTLEEINRLIYDRRVSLEKIMGRKDAHMLRKCLKKAAGSIQDEIEQRKNAKNYLEWMNGEPRDPPKRQEPSPGRRMGEEHMKGLEAIQAGSHLEECLPREPYDGIDPNGELLVIGHGV